MKRNVRALMMCMLFTCISLVGKAQSLQEVKNSGRYLYGEGDGNTAAEADKQALSMLLSQISVTVENNAQQQTLSYNKNDKEVVESQFKNVISSYARATLVETQIFKFTTRKGVHIVRYISKNNLNRIFEGRKARVLEYVENADVVLHKRKIGDALKNYYWAYMLIQTLPYPNELEYSKDGHKHTLSTWIPMQINSILDNIDAEILGKNEMNETEMRWTYKNQLVDNISYTYHDGISWSNICSIKDGLGFMELPEGNLLDRVKVHIEYAYVDEAKNDEELKNIVDPNNILYFPKAELILLLKKSVIERSNFQSDVEGYRDSEEPKKSGNSSIVTPINPGLTNDGVTNSDAKTSGSDASKRVNSQSASQLNLQRNDTVMKQVLYNLTHHHAMNDTTFFTSNGLDLYNALIQRGHAKLLGNNELNYYSLDHKTYCKGIHMKFSFSNNCKNIVEDVVFTLNDENKISNIQFGLGSIASDEIMQKSDISDQAKLALIDFLETYKTAYALKQLSFISSVFADDAVIITGSIYKCAKTDSEYSFKDQEIVRYTKSSKNQYINNLRHIFRSNEFINLHFENNDIIKTNLGENFYGIQIKQDYSSTHYSDSGYLFLLVDVNDPEHPIIHVRTWQPRKDKTHGIIGIYDFE